MLLKNNVNTILESREIAKKDKARIMTALGNYAKYGEFSRFTDVISEERLKEIRSEEMTEKMKNLLQIHVCVQLLVMHQFRYQV